MWGKINALCTAQSTDVPTRPPGLLCPPQVSTLYAQPSVACSLAAACASALSICVDGNGSETLSGVRQGQTAWIFRVSVVVN